MGGAHADGETPEGEKLTEGAAHDTSAEVEEEENEESLPGCTLFIKNLHFDTTEETLKGVSDRSARREWVGVGGAGDPVC